jgi:hypothetical protein
MVAIERDCMVECHHIERGGGGGNATTQFAFLLTLNSIKTFSQPSHKFFLLTINETFQTAITGGGVESDNEARSGGKAALREAAE